MDLNTFRHLGRFKEIVLTLARFGFDEVVDRLELPAKFLPFPSTKAHLDLPFEERLRLLLEALGPTYIKLGQVLSLRPDLAPAKLIESLRKLQDQVAPVPFEDIKPVVEAELGAPLEELFAAFDQKPLATASLGQVHRAVLPDGKTSVAVKILKPGIRERMASDLSLLESLAETLDGKVEALQLYDLPGMVRELSQILSKEIDFLREARNIGIARANLEGLPRLRIPMVFDEYSSEQVLTMELLIGQKLNDVKTSELKDREEIAKAGLHALLKQILEDGFFHADPHPGNLVLLEGGVIGLLDWGMVGRLTKRMRYSLVSMVHAVEHNDSERVIQVLLQLSDADPPPQMEMLEREILDVMDAYSHVPVGEIRVGTLMSELINVFREYGIRVPPGLASVVKALLSGEGAVRLLYPELDVIAEAEPIVRRLAVERYRPHRVMHSLFRTLENAWQLHSQLPNRIDRLIRKAEQGEATIKLRHENLGGLRETLDNIFNRLALAITLAAMFLGSSIIITTKVEPFLFGYPALGVIGYVISGILGLWLVVNILRHKKY